LTNTEQVLEQNAQTDAKLALLHEENKSTLAKIQKSRQGR
jgi:hypothetical protein